MTEEPEEKYRDWSVDFSQAKEFCEKYQFSYGHTVYNESKYSVFFIDVDGDEIVCYLSINTGDLKTRLVNYDDIVLSIPLNILNLSTNVYEELEKYCLENKIISL
jgi:hypothetical protein